MKIVKVAKSFNKPDQFTDAVVHIFQFGCFVELCLNK